ncbi:hypothetical protein [Helicobacter monodelphidis]|uniref:hypothetical protein n=1 Tax=Helicobacter sp. 15-1451 TaxID=2004995 RepID=UPI0011BFA0BE|nr:hypothetical protein [Helicobacter sp. 15-1451]
MLEMVIIIMLLGILATFFIPQIFVSTQNTCRQRINASLSMISSQIANQQNTQFLLNSYGTIDFAKSTQNALFDEKNCALKLKNNALIFRLNQYTGEIRLVQEDGIYQFKCVGQDCIKLNNM